MTVGASFLPDRFSPRFFLAWKSQYQSQPLVGHFLRFLGLNLESNDIILPKNPIPMKL